MYIVYINMITTLNLIYKDIEEVEEELKKDGIEYRVLSEELSKVPSSFKSTRLTLVVNNHRIIQAYWA